MINVTVTMTYSYPFFGLSKSEPFDFSTLLTFTFFPSKSANAPIFYSSIFSPPFSAFFSIFAPLKKFLITIVKRIFSIIYQKTNVMVTVTLEYEERNPIAQSVIKMLHTLGVFKISKAQVISEEELSEEKEKEGFLYTSKINASKHFEKYL